MPFSWFCLPYLSQMPFSKKHLHNHHHFQFEFLFPCLAWFHSLQVLQAPEIPASSVSSPSEQLVSAEYQKKAAWLHSFWLSSYGTVLASLKRIYPHQDKTKQTYFYWFELSRRRPFLFWFLCWRAVHNMRKNGHGWKVMDRALPGLGSEPYLPLDPLEFSWDLFLQGSAPASLTGSQSPHTWTQNSPSVNMMRALTRKWGLLLPPVAVGLWSQLLLHASQSVMSRHLHLTRRYKTEAHIIRRDNHYCTPVTQSDWLPQEVGRNLSLVQGWGYVAVSL